MHKKLILFSLVLLIILMPAFGLYFSTSLTTIKDKITLEGSAEFKITIRNEEKFTQTFHIKSGDYPRWDILTKPVQNPILVEIGPEDEATLNLFIYPNPNYIGKQGSHVVNIIIESKITGERIILQPKIGMISGGEEEPKYVPTIIATTNFPAKVNPEKSLDFSITLSNQNKLKITKALLAVTSSLIDERIEVDLEPLEEKVIDIKKELDPKTKPRGDKLTIALIYEDKNVFEPMTISYEIASYSRVTDEHAVKEGFLTKTEAVKFTNKGNVPFKGELKVKTTAFKRLFGSTEPDARVEKKDGEQYYAWDANLQPYGSMTVTISENYISIMLFLVAVIFVALILYFRRNPVIIEKNILDAEIHEGALSRAKITLNVKNVGLKKLQDISVIDKVPKILHIEKPTIIGSLKPSKIMHSRQHDILILWELKELMPGEERVITYYVKSILSILGGLNLQPAMVTFKKNGKDIKIRSNRAFIKEPEQNVALS